MRNQIDQSVRSSAKPGARRHTRPGLRAFTIVELLVVISIIVLLIAMLLPALRNARESGRRAACLSNLRQLVLGISMYNSDFGDIPQNRDSLMWGQYNFCSVLYPNYISAEPAFFCPNILNVALATWGFVAVPGSGQPDYLGYYYLGGQPIPSVAMYGPLASPAANNGFKELKPSEKLLYSDICVPWPYAPTMGLYFTAHPAATVWTGDVPVPDGVNQGYVDGHGAWSPFSKLHGLGGTWDDHY